MGTHYHRLADVRTSRRFSVVAGRPVGSDFGDRERHNFLAHERAKPLHSERLLERYDWRTWLRDMRDAAITIALLAIALGALDTIVELLS